MKKVTLQFQNCYGIRSLKCEFDFSKKKTQGIYASNASMKTSFANTFFQISNGKSPEEKIFGKTPSHNIQIDNHPILKEDIFVIKSFVDNYESKNMSVLLVNPKNKKEYDDVSAGILDEKKKLITKLNKLSGVKKDEIEKQMLNDFNQEDFFTCIKEIDTNSDEYATISYGDIFNNDVAFLLNDDIVSKNLKEYIEIYNKLLEESPYFKKGMFNPSKADTVSKILKKENFFRADHKVKLNGEESLLGEQELEEKLSNAKKAILENESLKKIEELITAKIAAKEFQEVISNNPGLLIELEKSKIGDFRKKLWTSYLKKEELTYKQLLEKYDTNKKRLDEIEQEAALEKTKWIKVVSTFKSRFFPPFEDIELSNEKSAILGTELPTLVFIFKDPETGDIKKLNRNGLETSQTLSQGEKRAVYLLNIIFEIEAKKESNRDILFIIDDIADSFDYRNKYAIVEYLKEMATYEHFYQIILTHNFDFFRTIQSRLESGCWKNYFIAHNNTGVISLEPIQKLGIISPFENWKDNMHLDEKKLIALVPFVRNLLSYTQGDNSPDYLILTSLLHIKPDSYLLKISDIESIFGKEFHNPTLQLPGSTRDVLPLIFQLADRITATDECPNLENKILLSIAIRLHTEKFMIEKINNPSEIISIYKNQTTTLSQIYSNMFPQEMAKIKILERVNLMTPENIHLNSFMYEPILDLSEKHLIELYRDVKTKLI